MPKLLQINVTSNWGSTGKIAEAIGEVAQKRGWECYVAYGRYSSPSKLHTIRVGNDWVTYFHYFLHRFFDMEGLGSVWATKKLVRQIKRLRPDIIHLHNIHDHWLNYPLLFRYLNQTDIRVVWTFHDFWAMTGHCSHFVHSKCLQWQSGCEKCPYTRGKVLPLVKGERRNFELKKRLFTENKNLRIVCVSEWVGENVRESFLKGKEIRVISNGVDVDIFKPTSVERIDTRLSEAISRMAGKFVILAVATSWKGGGKGFADYLALSKVLREDELIVLVGLNEEAICGSPSNIEGISFINNQSEMAALYTRADVVTSFSSAETFGMTVVEGYACGTPAVVYDNTAPRSLITKGTGFVVPDGDYNAAYRAVQKIKAEGKKSYSEACIALAREKYDQRKCFGEYVRVYEELIMS